MRNWRSGYHRQNEWISWSALEDSLQLQRTLFDRHARRGWGWPPVVQCQSILIGKTRKIETMSYLVVVLVAIVCVAVLWLLGKPNGQHLGKRIPGPIPKPIVGSIDQVSHLVFTLLPVVTFLAFSCAKVHGNELFGFRTQFRIYFIRLRASRTSHAIFRFSPKSETVVLTMRR